MATERMTVDLSAYPDLVVMYFGMRVNALTGIKTLIGFGPKIESSHKAKPDGLLLHEQYVLSLIPPHVGFRQYWRDLESVQRWAASEPHRQWWKNFVRDSGGTGFWHEAYSIRGGFEGIYDDMKTPIGMMKFAPVQPARGAMYSSARRLKREFEDLEGAVAEEELYSR